MREAARIACFEHGERIAQKISRTTKEGMARRRAEGGAFGNPEIRTSVQPLGVATWSNAAEKLVLRIADVLRKQGDPYGLSYGQVANILNESGLLTLHGKEWTASRVRIPIKRAREMLMGEDEDALRSLPTFGMA